MERKCHASGSLPDMSQNVQQLYTWELRSASGSVHLDTATAIFPLAALPKKGSFCPPAMVARRQLLLYESNSYNMLKERLWDGYVAVTLSWLIASLDLDIFSLKKIEYFLCIENNFYFHIVKEKWECSTLSGSFKKLILFYDAVKMWY